MKNENEWDFGSLIELRLKILGRLSPAPVFCSRYLNDFVAKRSGFKISQRLRPKEKKFVEFNKPSSQWKILRSRSSCRGDPDHLVEAGQQSGILDFYI